MRLGLILALLLAGCSREPSFDERYAATQKQLSDKAAEIDRDVASGKNRGAERTATGAEKQQAPGNPGSPH